MLVIKVADYNDLISADRKTKFFEVNLKNIELTNVNQVI